MQTETLSTLKINKLSQEQYDRELANGNIDENAIYLTPDTELDLAEVEQTLKEQGDEIEVVKGDLTSHTNSSNAQFTLVREEFANADAETLKSAKEYSDANKNSAIGEAKAYTDQEIEKLVTDTEFEGVFSTIQDIQNAMATDEELAQALETANGKKVDKGAKGSATQPIYFDDNGAQPIAYTIEKSVPADAKFTDTTYTLIKDTTNKKIQLMNGDKLVSEVDDNNTTYTIDGSLSTSSTNPIQNKVVAENINNLQKDIDANASEIEEINSKDLFETKHKEGNVIAVSDSAEAPFVGMKLYGKTTQNGTPTPDNPIELKSVGDSGSFELGVYGKNLFEIKTSGTTNKGIIYTVNADKSISISGAPTDTTSWKNLTANSGFYLPNGKYTLTCSGYKDLSKCFPAMYYKTESGNKELATLVNSSGTTTFEITTGKNNVYLIIGCNPTYTPQGERLYISIVPESVTDLSYEQYTKQTLTMPYTLRGVGDIKDEVDFNRGVKIPKLAVGELTEVLNVTELTNCVRVGTQLPYTVGNEYIGLSTHFPYLAQHTVDTEHFYCGLGGVQCFLFIDKKRLTAYDKDTIQAWIIAQKIKVLYPLKTPIETPLTEQELNAYRHLMTNKPNTTILSEADMEVDYVVNSTSAEYIENRLDTLKSDIDKISSGGSSLATVATTGDYNDLSNKPTIPTKTSQLINDSSFINQTGLNTALEDKLSFDEEVVNSESSVIKAVPEGSGKYAAVNKIGGMSYKSHNLLNFNNSHTTTETTRFVFQYLPIRLEANKTYTLSFHTNVAAGHGYQLSYRTTSGAYASFDSSRTTSDTRQTFVFTTPADGIEALSFYLNVIGGTVREFMVNEGNKALEYEPYYSGIRNAAVTSITFVGKNLFDGEIVQGHTTHTNAVTTRLRGTKIIIAEAGKKYTITKYGDTDNVFGFAVNSAIPNSTYPIDADNISYIGNNVAFMYNSATYSFTAIKDGVFTLLFSRKDGGDLTPEDMAHIKFQVEVGDSTEYEPYKESVLSIPTGARGVGYGMGINEDCYNYIDFERKVYVQRCKKVSGFVLTGTNTNTKVFTAYVSGLIGGVEGSNNVLCSHLDIYGFHTQDKPHFYIDSNWNTINVYLPISVNDSVASEIEVIAALATPIETDISQWIQDNFIEVAAGGIIIAVNEYNYDAPTEISFFTSENPEKVIVADKIVGDLVGVAEEAQSLTGLESTIEELNYLHKGVIEEEGWLVPESGELDLDGMPGATGPLGIVVGNSYTFTLTYTDGTVKTETITAIDASTEDSMWPVGTPAIQGSNYEGIMIVDKVLSNENEEFVVGNNYYWSPPSYIDSDLASVKMTGKKANGASFTHQVEIYNKIPLGHLPDGIGEPPVIQEWKWTNSDTGKISSGIEFQKPEGYNRCEIFAFDRKLKSSGSATIYGTLMFPMCKEDGNDWDGYTYVGETPANAKLGMGEGDTTTGGTEWIIALKGECSFLEQGCIFTYHYGAEKTKTINISSAAGAPSSFTGQFSCVLNSDSDKTSILDSSLQWHFLAIPEENQGNYIKVIWYKD